MSPRANRWKECPASGATSSHGYDAGQGDGRNAFGASGCRGCSQRRPVIGRGWVSEPNGEPGAFAFVAPSRRAMPQAMRKRAFQALGLALIVASPVWLTMTGQPNFFIFANAFMLGILLVIFATSPEGTKTYFCLRLRDRSRDRRVRSSGIRTCKEWRQAAPRCLDLCEIRPPGSMRFLDNVC